MPKQHENYRELVWVLAKTDFKLRYQGSVLGYVWALLKPLLMFLILNFVFSSLFVAKGAGGAGIPNYSLQLITAIMMFNFFSEGTSAGMGSLLSKAQLVTKIYVPRWTIILAATLNSALIYVMNLVVIAGFFLYKQFFPSLPSIIIFLAFSVAIYILILSFSLLTAPLYVRFRDLSLIWEVITQILFYATPVFYSLQMMPDYIQRILLISPIAYIIHFTKEALINDHYASPAPTGLFLAPVLGALFLSVFAYRRLIPDVAEEI